MSDDHSPTTPHASTSSERNALRTLLRLLARQVLHRLKAEHAATPPDRSSHDAGPDANE
jgi:hypothetical protein